MTKNPYEFRQKLQNLINSISLENGSDTPDFILAEYLNDCLQSFDRAVNAREKWYGRQQERTPFYDCPEPPPNKPEFSSTAEETLWETAAKIAKDLWSSPARGSGPL